MGKFARWLLLWCVVAALGASAHAHSALPARYSDQLRKSPLLSHKRAQWTHSTKIDVLARIRGGAEPKKKQAQQQTSILKSVTNTLGRIKPATRSFLLLSAICTLVHLSGVVNAPRLFMLDRRRIWELWRPFTASAFLGGLTMSTLTNLYLLLKYGTAMEESSGAGEHLWFLLTQIFLTSLIGWIFQLPFMSTSIVAAHLYCYSRLDPYAKVSWYFGSVLNQWHLPFCLMAIECVQAQNPLAAIPHVIGMTTGHIYHFGHNVWPKLGGRRLIEAPEWFRRRFGDRPSSNVGIDFRKTSTKKETSSKRQRVKSSKAGKKLGTGSKSST